MNLEIITNMINGLKNLKREKSPSGYVPLRKEWEVYVRLHKDTFLQPGKVILNPEINGTIGERAQEHVDYLLGERDQKGLGGYSKEQWQGLYEGVAIVTIAEVRMAANPDIEKLFLIKLDNALPHFNLKNPKSVGAVQYPEVPYEDAQ